MHRQGSRLRNFPVCSGLPMQNGCAADVWGFRGLAPVGALHTPHRADACFLPSPLHPLAICRTPLPLGGKMADVGVGKSARQFCDTMRLLPLYLRVDISSGGVEYRQSAVMTHRRKTEVDGDKGTQGTRSKQHRGVARSATEQKEFIGSWSAAERFGNLRPLRAVSHRLLGVSVAVGRIAGVESVMCRTVLWGLGWV